MNLLAFDTATNACTVALQANDRIFSRHEIAPSQQASLILPMIQQLLLEANMALSDLDAIAFGCGPGSFMGVRLATATAQGLGFGLHIPLIPVSTLQTLAQTAGGASTVIAAWDARMDELYWGIYRADQRGVMQTQKEDVLSAPGDIDIAEFSTVGFKLVGNAWSVYEKQLPAVLFSQGTSMQTELYPDAKAMLTIASQKYLQKEIISSENAHPHYLRHQVVHQK